MIADTDYDAWIFKTELFKNRKQQTTERHFACCDKYSSVLQVFAFRNFGFARFDVVKRYSYMFKKFFALGLAIYIYLWYNSKSIYGGNKNENRNYKRNEF